jgi:regulator of protease activity HflC (stomatin/prohibitin superfamily)
MLRGSWNVISGIIALVTLVVAFLIAGRVSQNVVIVVLAVGGVLTLSPRMIREWERGVLLRLGKYQRICSPGIAWIIPGIDMITQLVDMRIRATSFSAEKALTKDTVPVNVDAVLFWIVTDAQKAILEVERYLTTVTWAAQTTLRDVIGGSDLVRMICDRESLDVELQKTIDAKTSEWGVTVQSVEIRDVRIPGSLEDAMSRKAQADREKEARIILAESELKVAEQMSAAATIYDQSAHAMQLRAMNMTYESVKERGALMVIPSGMANVMDPGVIGVAATAFRVEPDAKDAS